MFTAFFKVIIRFLTLYDKNGYVDLRNGIDAGLK